MQTLLIRAFTFYDNHLVWSFTVSQNAHLKVSNQETAIIIMFTLQVMLSILITWFVCGILTVSDVLPNDLSKLEYRARTDSRIGIYPTPPGSIYHIQVCTRLGQTVE